MLDLEDKKSEDLEKVKNHRVKASREGMYIGHYNGYGTLIK